jgi:hypothetical protein
VSVTDFAFPRLSVTYAGLVLKLVG